ncbi:MAG: PEP-CTERM sorting domain-containing protein [Phycisphaerales bacterium]|nr:PEP-CTERM sorting domain-containing protein [Phycisphaerales bacterium]
MRCRGLRGLFAVAVVAAGAVKTASADAISFISQDRSVAAVAGVVFGGSHDLEQNTESAPDFNVFDAFVSADASLPHVATAHAEATQFSELSPFEISGHGAVAASALDEGVDGLDVVIADSALLVTFFISEAVAYTAQASLFSEGTPGFGAVSAGFRLTGPGGDLVNFVFSGGASSILAAGVLQPGQYTLEAGGAFSALNAPHNVPSDFFGSFDFRLAVVPEPATAFLIGAGLLALRRRR